MNRQLLQDAGVNYAEGVARFAGKAELYETYLQRFVDDPSFSRLREAMEREAYAEAFQQAHALKGAAGNLDIVPLFTALAPLAEALRNGRDVAGARAIFPKIIELYTEIVAAITQSAITPER